MIDGVHTTDETARDRAFERAKSSGQQPVHRLRQWETGDTLWGYVSLTTGGSMGKTFRADRSEGPTSLELTDATDRAKDSYNRAVENAGPGTAVFLYRATIGEVSTDAPGPDPGEPPLKWATFSDVTVEKSHYESEDE